MGVQPSWFGRSARWPWAARLDYWQCLLERSRRGRRTRPRRWPLLARRGGAEHSLSPSIPHPRPRYIAPSLSIRLLANQGSSNKNTNGLGFTDWVCSKSEARSPSPWFTRSEMAVNGGPRFNEQIEAMTLGNMRANGVRSLDVSCWQCHHRTILSADPWPDHVPVPSFGPRARNH